MCMGRGAFFKRLTIQRAPKQDKEKQPDLQTEPRHDIHTVLAVC